jgi:hypothetical protein
MDDSEGQAVQGSEPVLRQSSHAILNWKKGKSKLFGVSFVRTLIPFLKAPSS